MKIDISVNKDFFILRNALENIGEYPQHQTMSTNEREYNYQALDSVHKLRPDGFMEYVNEVDFSKSSFWLTTSFKKEKVKKLNIKTPTDLENARTRYYDKFKFLIRSEYFSLHRKFLTQMDMFALLGGDAFPTHFFVSSNLREAIETEQCTGLKFVERHNWEESHPFWPHWSCLLNLN